MASSRIHWSRMGESGTLIGMKFLLLINQLFGRRGFLLFLSPAICYFYLFRREARLASRQYLAQIRSFLPADQQVSLSPFWHFLMFGEILMDKLLVWMGHIRRDDVVFETSDTIEIIEKSRKGGIIVVSHLGNFEVCSALASQIPEMRLTLLVYTRHAERFNSLMKRVSGKVDVKIMQVTDVSPATAMLLSERVNAGEYIVIAGDRTPVTGQKRVSNVNFLGRTAPMPQGAFILAGLLQCPVYFMFCLKQRGHYHIYLELFTERLKFNPRKERISTLNKAVQTYASRLEYYCLKAPMQWFNFYPFWGDDLDRTENLISTNERDISVK